MGREAGVLAAVQGVEGGGGGVSAQAGRCRVLGGAHQPTCRRLSQA